MASIWKQLGDKVMTEGRKVMEGKRKIAMPQNQQKLRRPKRRRIKGY